MHIKEYRIPLPFSVEEYRRAQLYMVARVSREHTTKGEGVEILVNEPFDDENGKGQYTHKVFHLGSHLPTWLNQLIPTGFQNKLTVEEKAWNSYPYCKTIYTCPLMGERFSMSIETKYLEDCGNQDNVFGNTKEKYEVDIIDVVNDPLAPAKYKPEEDPSKYHSEKTNRGPFQKDWRETIKPIMCSYKLCKVNFQYWGLQTVVENYIHQYGLRDFFFLGHRQVVCWLDEWWDLTINDLRKFEQETQAALNQTINGPADGKNETTSTTVIK